jgi:manganese efflux pump family protein
LLKLLLFVLPLSLDTFAVSAALGLRGLPKRDRVRISLLLPSFEMAMPIVGLLAGRGLGHALGDAASYVAVAVLLGLGVWMLLSDEEGEQRQVERLSTGHGIAMFALGLSISLDELTIGLTIGLLHLSIWIAVGLIGAQALLAAQLGLRLGTRLNEKLREGAERLAGIALLGLGTFFLVEKLTG